MGFVPTDRDRSGFRRTRQGSEHALATGTAIPNDESILVLNWMRCDLGGTSTDHYIGVGPNETVGGERVSMLRDDDTIKIGVNDGGWQLVVVPIPDSGDHLWGVLVDRDNTLLDIYLDGVLVSSAALTNDPDLTANNQVQFNNSTGGVNSQISWTGWRGMIQTFANGSTPSQANLGEALRAMCSPEAPVHATISGAVGSVYNDWNLGEGLYGATTISDNGTSSDDFTIQGGLAIEDVRVRAKTPVRRPEKTHYGLRPGYTANINRDFGFAVQPIVIRIVHGPMIRVGSSAQSIRLQNAAGDRAIIYTEAVASTVLQVRRAGAPSNILLLGDQDLGGDIWFVIDGIDIDYVLNGQWIGGNTMAGALDWTGNVDIDLRGYRGQICRVAAWNPATVLATLEAEIRACVMNPEIDPASLGTPLADFPLNETTLPLATSSTVANQGTGGGTLTLSAQRSTSCKVMYAARS